MWRLSMKRTPFSRAENSIGRAMEKPPQTHPGAPSDSAETPGT